MDLSTVPSARPAVPPHLRGREGSRPLTQVPRERTPEPEARGQLLPPHPGSPENAGPGTDRRPTGAPGWGEVGGPRRRAPTYLALAGPRLGHPPGARLSARSLRTWPPLPPARPQLWPPS